MFAVKSCFYNLTLPVLKIMRTDGAACTRELNLTQALVKFVKHRRCLGGNLSNNKFRSILAMRPIVPSDLLPEDLPEEVMEEVLSKIYGKR